MQHFYEPKTALKNKGFLFCFVLKKRGERKNEEGTFDAQMNLEDIRLNEESQSQKDKYCVSPLT